MFGEAPVLASLNHQNIGHHYGVDDSAGLLALVMELPLGKRIVSACSSAAAEM